jgi:hypothetical protein
VERHNEVLRLEPLETEQIGRLRDLRNLPPKRPKEDDDDNARQ